MVATAAAARDGGSDPDLEDCNDAVAARVNQLKLVAVFKAVERHANLPKREERRCAFSGGLQRRHGTKRCWHNVGGSGCFGSFSRLELLDELALLGEEGCEAEEAGELVRWKAHGSDSSTEQILLLLVPRARQLRTDCAVVRGRYEMPLHEEESGDPSLVERERADVCESLQVKYTDC